MNNDNAYAYRFELARDTKQISTSMSYNEVGANFNPEISKTEDFHRWRVRVFPGTRRKGKGEKGKGRGGAAGGVQDAAPNSFSLSRFLQAWLFLS